MEELYTTWKAIGVAGGDLSFFQDFFVKFYQAFIEGDRWLQYLNGVKTTLLVTALALILPCVVFSEFAVANKLDSYCSFVNTAESYVVSAPCDTYALSL